MNQAYYDHCGKAFIETFRMFWPDEIHLYVYNEDMINPKKRKFVSYIDWSELGQDYLDFNSRNENSRVQQFAKKAFPIIHAMENIDCDHLIWIDSDVACTANMHHLILDMLTPKDVLSTHYGVKHPWPTDDEPDRLSFSCETGFFIVNKRHSLFPKMAARYKEYYVKDLGRDLRRFYDGEVYGAVVAEMQQDGAKLMELNDSYDVRTPIPRSVMAPYISHYKAGEKDNHSNESILEALNIQPNE